MHLSLIVIKTHQLEQLKQFYETLGLAFLEEKHGIGPVHFSASVEKTIFEIYPLPKSVEAADTTTRLGFEIEKLEETIVKLKAIQAEVITEPKQTPWGYSATVKDPDGRSVELTQKPEMHKK